MVIIGVDSHKRNHTFVAVDEVGKKLSEKTLPATSDGHLDALAGASRATDTSTQGHEVGHNKGQAARDNDDGDPASKGVITARGSSQS